MSQKFTHQLIAPYIRKLQLPSPELSVKIAELSEAYYKKVSISNTSLYVPAACIGAALIKNQLDTPELIKLLSKMCALPLDQFKQRIEAFCTELNIPCNLTFANILEKTKLPMKFEITAMKVFQTLLAQNSNNQNLSKRSVYAAIILIIATKRGLPKKETAIALSEATQASSEEIINLSKILRNDLGSEFQMKKTKPQDEHLPDLPPQERKEIREHIDKIMNEIKSEKKKKKQTTLSFQIAPK